MREWVYVRVCVTERRADGVFIAGPGPTFEPGWRNVSRSDESATCVGEQHVPEFPRELGGLVVCPLGDGCLGDGPTCLAAAATLAEEARVRRMEEALRLIGYSHHTRSPRFGHKAQTARWGLGEDSQPATIAP